MKFKYVVEEAGEKKKYQNIWFFFRELKKVCASFQLNLVNIIPFDQYYDEQIFEMNSLEKNIIF